jgi:type III secretion protein U
MAEKNDGGDKTEKPTAKKLKDARKKGDVARSKEITSVVLLGAWLLLAVLFLRPVTERLLGIFEMSLSHTAEPYRFMPEAGRIAFEGFAILTAMTFVPIMLIGIMTEFLQIGAIFAPDKLKPKLEKMNPVEGFKRMFAVDNLVEVAKTLAKAVLLIWISWLVIQKMLPDMMRLPNSSAGGLQNLFWQSGFLLFGWTLLVFAFVAVLDVAYQNHSFTKKMKMSMRDIKQEYKDSEGDPYLKAHRKQLQQEWATTNAQASARQASVLVVNPTHLAIALNYDPDKTPVPIVSAKGEDLMALAMREAATEAGVPILRNIELARTLHTRVSLESVVPSDMFELVAQVIVWAKQVQESRAAGAKDVPTGPGAEKDDPGTGKPPETPPAAKGAGLKRLPPVDGAVH